MELMVVILVTLLMVTFVSFAIYKIKQQLEVQVSKDVDRLSVYYDSILDEKTAQLEAKIAQLEGLNKGVEEVVCVSATSDTQTTVITNDSKYVHSDFFKDYNKVKNKFCEVAGTHALAKVIELVEEGKDNKVNAYKEVLDTLDFNLQYSMQSLKVQDQLEVLQTVLGESRDKNEILVEFTRIYDGFDLSQFIAYIKDYIFYNDTEIVVASNQGVAFSNDNIPGVRYVKDMAIGEGYQIRFKDRLYDYSISLGGNNE